MKRRNALDRSTIQMIRGIDHIVHVVRNLASASAAYERLGFQVGAENVHPWGTRNRLVQVPGSYIELLSLPEPEISSNQTSRSYSFSNFNRDFLAECGEGFSFLALQSNDPKAEKAAFDKAGFGGIEVLDFSRKGKRADGSETEVTFTLTFARDPASPHAGFFACLHKTPERVWFPELQRHKNGVTKISAAVFVAENPTDHHIFLEAVTGARDIHSSSLGLRIETPLGQILIYDPRGFSDAFGVLPPDEEGMRLAAIVFAVPNLDDVKRHFEDGDLTASEMHNRLVVGPPAACGVVMAFETA
jgi:hypothetical protein